MPRALALLLLTVLALPAAALANTPPTLDELLAEHYAARGGLDKLRAIESIEVHGTQTLGARTLGITVRQKRPNKLRIEVRLGDKTIIQGYDGQSAWRLAAFMQPEPLLLDGERAEGLIGQAHLNRNLVDFAAKGYQLRLAGPQDVLGRATWAIEVTKKNGDVVTHYLDQQTHLELATSQVAMHENKLQTLWTYVREHGEVNGLLFPFVEETQVGGQVTRLWRVDGIQLDVPFEDGLFSVPR